MEEFVSRNEQETDSLITMPTDEEIVKQLCLKLKEYKQRERQNPSSLNTKYKIMVLEEVLKKGIAGYNELSKKIPSADKAPFDNAFEVIKSYVVNGGGDITGGTGFPKINKKS